MSKQTAVEWLEKICNDRGYHLMEDYFKQAKAMEREQIIDAHGLKYYDLNEETVTGEQYYLKTYKGGEQ